MNNMHQNSYLMLPRRYGRPTRAVTELSG